MRFSGELLTRASIEAVLFDADGVFQRPSFWWRRAFGRLLRTPDAERIDAFARDFDAAERSALCVSAGFEDVLAIVLERWNCPDRLDEALRILTTIEIYDDILDTAQWVRRSGLPCHLATNQQAHRARHMTEVMAYRELFDREFYSCFLGAAKPEIKFFATVLRELDLPGLSVLFLDDREENVAAARAAGLRAEVFDGSHGAGALRAVLSGFGVKFGQAGEHGASWPRLVNSVDTEDHGFRHQPRKHRYGQALHRNHP